MANWKKQRPGVGAPPHARSYRKSFYTTVQDFNDEMKHVQYTEVQYSITKVAL